MARLCFPFTSFLLCWVLVAVITINTRNYFRSFGYYEYLLDSVTARLLKSEKDKGKVKCLISRRTLT